MLYIVAVGLLVVYGVLKIINLAHGAFLAMGAYAGVLTTWAGWNPWTALLLAAVMGVAVAALVEWRVLRALYARPPRYDPRHLGPQHHRRADPHALLRARDPLRRERDPRSRSAWLA